MNKVLIVIFLTLSILNSIYSQEERLKLKNENNRENDSTTIELNPIAPDTTIKNDTLNIRSDTLKVQKQSTIIPLSIKGLLTPNGFTSAINRNMLLFSDYRYTGDFIKQFSLGFIRDLGMLGQPHEVLVYGSGLNNISYLQDGIFLNNRFTNSFDLNNIQSESIDSIEIIPSVRGFLYGNNMNPVSINFISKNDYGIEGKKGSYSRLRYYQAPNEEAMIDAIFKTNIFQRLIGFFEMTNKTIADQFQNSNYSSWKATAKLNYLLSDNFNLIGNYNYLKSEVHLFGGINLDSLSKMVIRPTINFYYPVINLTRYQKNTEHNVYIKLLNKLSQNISGELNTYYRFNLLEFRQNERGTIPNKEIISRNHITKALGSTFSEVYEDSILAADLIANYEKIFVKTDFDFKEKQVNSISLSGKLSIKLSNNKFIPSLFGKYLYYDDQSLYGIGGDITFYLTSLISLYAGTSYFQKPLNILQKENISAAYPYFSYGLEGIKYQKTFSSEIGLTINQEPILTSVNLFYRQIDDDLGKSSIAIPGSSVYDNYNNEILGVGINLNLSIWKIFFESKGSFYYNKFEYKFGDRSIKERNYLLPEYSFRGGVFYKDILFDSNLDLKAGITANAIGSQDLYSYDFETSTFLNDYYLYQNTKKMAPSIVFDLVIIGEIQKRAIIYFTFENLLDKEYYMVPFYLKQGRGMRLGVSWEFLN